MSKPLLLIQPGQFRETIMNNPNLVLDDPDLMKALLSGGQERVGHDVLDFRTKALEKMSEELGQLKNTHSDVVATAYGNVASTNHIHRAILDILSLTTADEFLDYLTNGLAASLSVDSARLCLESSLVSFRGQHGLGAGLVILNTGEIDKYQVGSGRQAGPSPVMLRANANPSRRIFGEFASEINSEALLTLPIGEGIRPAMLALGSRNGTQFGEDMGTDLLDFYREIFTRVLNRWLD